MKRFVTASAIVFGLDLLSKELLVRFLPPKVVLIPGVLDLVRVRNPGVAFGLLAGAGQEGRFLLVVLALAVALGLALAARKAPPFQQWALGLIAGGALGNAWDRFWHGSVFDFIDLHWRTYHWPAFNLADMAITLGVGLYLWSLRRCR